MLNLNAEGELDAHEHLIWPHTRNCFVFTGTLFTMHCDCDNAPFYICFVLLLRWHGLGDMGHVEPTELAGVVCCVFIFM